MGEQTKTLRQLGDLERYTLARALIGFHPIIVIGVSLPTKLLDRYTTSTCRDILHQVVNELVVKERALSAIIVNENDLKPSFGQVQQEEFDPAKVVCIGHTASSPSPLTAEERINNLIKRNIDNHFDLGDKTAPLWRLTLERGNGKDDEGGEEAKEDDILAIAMSHTIGDGSSSRRLLVQTLQSLDEILDKYSESVSSTISWDKLKMLSIPLPLEDLYSVQPGFQLKIQTIYDEIIRPRLPQVLSRWISGPPPRVHWQANSVRPSAVFKSKFASKFIFLPSLYSVTHSNPLRKSVTVQSILQVLCQAAIFKTHIKFLNKKDAQQEQDSNDNELFLTTNTALGLDPPTGVLLGNYFAGITRPTRCTSRLKFWDEVLQYYNIIHSPYQREIAIHRMGGFKKIGDMKTLLLSKFADNPTEPSNSDVKNAPTVVGTMQYSSSLGVSNVGLLDRSTEKNNDNNNKVGNITLLSKCTKSFFGQTAPGCNMSLVVSIISISKPSEISVHIGWRDCVLEDGWVQYFAELLVIAANNLVKSTENPNIDMDLTLDDLFVL